jgi:hypothetical protein
MAEPLNTPAKTDWAEVIAQTGITPYKLALMSGIDPKTMEAYAEGRGEPRHSVGEWLKLLATRRNSSCGSAMLMQTA